MDIFVERRGHSCVVVQASGRLVIDPGVYSDVPGALARAEAVLVTHEHLDHIDVPAVAATDLPVYAPAPVVELLRAAGAEPARLHVVADGDEIAPAGVAVRVLGERHEQIHPDVPQPANVGYLVAGHVLHPGDAYVTLPEGFSVDLALVPLGGPWLRIADVIDWVRQVAPARVMPIHDAMLTPAGAALATQWIERLCDVEMVDPGLGIPVD
ncbi:MAG: MBL fold metallo-hydrolase [Micrococcales bacterium]|nr:MBL fold metallo-hydrolase [Micrococcales bacterium]